MKAYNIITIEREYASGGSEIGKKVADALGIPVYGREILEYIAKREGIPVESLEAHEETSTNSFLYSMYLLSQVYRGDAKLISQTDELNLYEQELIKQIAVHQKCIIIGRCAGWTLREREDVLSVFVTADKQFRHRRAVEAYGIEEKQADAVLQRFDKKRSAFYHDITKKSWHEKKGYHMVLDSSKLGIDTCAELISAAVKKSREA